MASHRRPVALNKQCVLIIVVASVERFTYKGVASNLVMYLTDVVKMSMSSAATSVGMWSGVTSMLPLVSAVMADSYWDRYSTITASSFLYVLGLIGLTIWAVLHTWLPCYLLFFMLYVISIGQGGYNPSLQAFGADQLGLEDDAESGRGEDKIKLKSLFFQWWYFGICSGSFLGNSIIPYVQDTVGWELGFTIPCIAMTLSVVVFFCCTPFYTQKQPISRPSPVTIMLQGLKEVFRNLIAHKIRLPLRDNSDDNIEDVELHTINLKDFIAEQKEAIDDTTAPSVTKTVLRILPIWATMLMFAVIFQQPVTFFTKQGMMMDHHVSGSFEIPPAMLQSAIAVSIILLMPLYDTIIVPLTSVITRHNKGITVLQRIGIGLGLSVVAMVIAALVETRRLHVLHEEGGTHLMSIFWLLPQYILLGVSDVFTVVGMQDFFYTQVPSTMKTIGIALYLSVFGVGSFLGAFLIIAVDMVTARTGKGHGWLSDDPQEAQLDNYYWFLALLSSISFVIFTYLCKYYNG